MAAEQHPLRLAVLLTAPLTALLQAQAQAELETLNYIVEVGLGGAEQRTVQTLEFELVQPIADPMHPGKIVPTPTQVSVPLLSILQTPSIKIADADVTFNVHITDVVELDEQEEGGTRRPAIDLIGVFAAAGAAKRLPTMSITMKVEAVAPQESYERVKRLLGDATTATAPEPERDSPEKP
jgi:hypothetical protein